MHAVSMVVIVRHSNFEWLKLLQHSQRGDRQTMSQFRRKKCNCYFDGKQAQSGRSRASRRDLSKPRSMHAVSMVVIVRCGNFEWFEFLQHSQRGDRQTMSQFRPKKCDCYFDSKQARSDPSRASRRDLAKPRSMHAVSMVVIVRHGNFEWFKLLQHS
jgi:hypothetical protein